MSGSALAFALLLFCCSRLSAGPDAASPPPPTPRYVWVAERLVTPSLQSAAAPVLLLAAADGKTVARSSECERISQGDEHWLCGRVAVPGTGVFVLKALAHEGATAQTAVVLNPRLRLSPGVFDVVLVLDASQSMRRNDPADLRLEAAEQFWSLARESRRIRTLSFIVFRETVDVLLKPTPPRQIQDLKPVLKRLRGHGSTDFNPPFEAATSLLQDGQAEQSAVLFLSDGKPIRTYRGTHKQLGELGCPVHTVGLSPEADGELLSQIARDTGGQFFAAPTADELEQIFTRVFAIIASPKPIVHRVIDVRGDCQLPLQIDRTMHNPVVTVALLRGRPALTLDGEGLATENAELASFRLGTAGNRRHTLGFTGQGRVLCDLTADTDVVLAGHALNPQGPVGLPLTAFFYLEGGEGLANPRLNCTIETPRTTTGEPSVEATGFGLYRVTWPDASLPGPYIVSADLMGTLDGAPVVRHTFLLFTRTAEATPQRGNAVRVAPVGVAPDEPSGPEALAAAMPDQPVADTELTATCRFSPAALQFSDLYPGEPCSIEAEILLHAGKGALPEYRVENLAEHIAFSAHGTLNDSRTSALTITAAPDMAGAGNPAEAKLVVSVGTRSWSLPITGQVHVPTIKADLAPMTVKRGGGTVHAHSTLTLSLAPRGHCPLTLTSGQVELSIESTDCVVGVTPVDVALAVSVPVLPKKLVWHGAVTIAGPGLESVVVPVRFTYGRDPPAVTAVSAPERPLPKTLRFPMGWLLPLLLLLALLVLLACLRFPERTPFFIASAVIHALILLLVLPRVAQEGSAGAPVTVMTVTRPPPIVEDVVSAETATDAKDSDTPADTPVEKSVAESTSETEDQAKEVEAADAASPAAPAATMQTLPALERSELTPVAVREEPLADPRRKRAEPKTPVQESRAAEMRKLTLELPDQPAADGQALSTEQVGMEPRVTVELSEDTPETSRAQLELNPLPPASEQLPVQREATALPAAQAAVSRHEPAPLTPPRSAAVRATASLAPPAPSTDAQPQAQLDPRSLPAVPARPAATESADVSAPSVATSDPRRGTPASTIGGEAEPTTAAVTVVATATRVRTEEGTLKATEELAPEADAGGPPPAPRADPMGTPASISTPVLPNAGQPAEESTEAMSKRPPRRRSTTSTTAQESTPAQGAETAASVTGQAQAAGRAVAAGRTLEAAASPPSPVGSAAPALSGSAGDLPGPTLPTATDGVAAMPPSLPLSGRSVVAASPGVGTTAAQPLVAEGGAVSPNSQTAAAGATVSSQALVPGEVNSHITPASALSAGTHSGVEGVARVATHPSAMASATAGIVVSPRRVPSPRGGTGSAAGATAALAISGLAGAAVDVGGGQTLGVDDAPAEAIASGPDGNAAAGSVVVPSSVGPVRFTPSVLTGPTDRSAVSGVSGRRGKQSGVRGPSTGDLRVARAPEPDAEPDVPASLQLKVEAGQALHGRPAAALLDTHTPGDSPKGHGPAGNRWRQTFPNLQHSGDWDCDRTAMLNLAHQFERRTGSTMPFDCRDVRVDAPEVSKAPFLFMSGHKDFRFTEEEVSRLRTYLQEGGYLWINDSTDVADQTFDRAARRELQRVLPGTDLRQIPLDHTLFRGPYDLTGGYKGFPVPPGDKYRQDHLEGVWLEERLRVIYTRNDYGDGLEIDERTGPLMASLTDLTAEEMQESSIRMGTNIAMYCINDGRLGEVRLASSPEDALLPLRVRARQQWDEVAGTPLAFIETPQGWGMPEGWGGDQFLRVDVRRAAGRTPGIRVDFDRGEHAFQGWRSQALVGHPCTVRFDRTHVVLVDVTSYLPGGGRVAVAFGSTGAVPYIETQAQFVRPGRNRNVPFDLGQATFKTAQTGWQHRASWPDGFVPDTIFLVVYPQGEKGRVDLTNLRIADRRPQ